MDDSEPPLLRLDKPTERAVDAIADFFTQLHAYGLDDLEFAPPHVTARASHITAPAAARARALGIMVLARAHEDADAPTDDTLERAIVSLQEEVGRALDSLPSDMTPLPAPLGKRAQREARDFALDRTGALLEEVALEERSAAALLGTTSDGQHVIGTIPARPAAVVVHSLVAVLQYLEVWVESSDLVVMERSASGWFFQTWSAPPLNQGQTFSQQIREQEFSLVDRVMVALEEPLGAATARHPTAEYLPPRQRALLDAVARSVCSLFVVRERRGAATVFEDLASGRRYDVREHNEELDYDAGFVGAGRLIPVAELGWIRSPGMVLWERPPLQTDPVLGDALRQMPPNLPRAIAIESLISMFARNVHVPRFIRPAATKKDASEIFYQIAEAMRDEGIAREPELSEIPPAMRPLAGTPDRVVVELPADVVLAAYMTALSDQAGLRPNAQPPRKARKKKPR